MGRRRLIGLVAPLLVLALTPACTPSDRGIGPTSTPSGPTSSATPDRPNIVLLLTDDQRWDTLWQMPNVQSLLAADGVTFSNAFVVNSSCCPSRASILSGNYSHTTGVYSNTGPHGGWEAFRSNHDERSTIATWLQGAGYRTAMMGKYFNGYRTTYVPPGWDRWFAWMSPAPSYFDYTVNVDGKAVHYGLAANDYSTDVLASQADRFIRSTPASQPLFLYWAPSAPHAPSIPAPRHASVVPDRPFPQPPNLNEADVSDKPAYLQGGPVNLNVMADLELQRYRTVQAVDDAVGKIVSTLEQTGRLSNTVIVFMSDNGIAQGEHRWRYKLVPYEESIRVPLVIRYDPLTTGESTIQEMALNIDIAPTLADLAGVTPASPTEGTSLLPLLEGTGTSWRSDFLIENLGFERGDSTSVPTFCAVRSTRWMFARYETGEQELYDLRADPYELTNLAADPAYADVVERMLARDRQLCSPRPPGFGF